MQFQIVMRCVRANEICYIKHKTKIEQCAKMGQKQAIRAILTHVRHKQKGNIKFGENSSVPVKEIQIQ
jgi:hypothetical protein